MYPQLSTRRRLLLALLILGGKSTYSNLKSFLPGPGPVRRGGYSGPKFYGMLKRLEADGLIRRLHRPSSIVHLPADQRAMPAPQDARHEACTNSTEKAEWQAPAGSRVRIEPKGKWQAKAGRPSVRLLPAGLELLERRFGSRIFQLTDKGYKNYKDYNQSNWSLVILNFPTESAYSRSRLAARLLELGCGSLRDGVYLSPYPILPAAAEWAEENRVLPNVSLLSILPTPYSLLPASAWDLPALSRRYLSFLDRLNIARGIALPRKRQRAIHRIKSDFLDLLIRDPLLPKPLLPPDYPLARVIGEMTALDKDISTDETKIDNLPGKKLAKNRI